MSSCMELSIDVSDPIQERRRSCLASERFCADFSKNWAIVMHLERRREGQINLNIDHSKPILLV